MNTTAIGRRAEAAAAAFLQRHGCRIIAQNWRTRRCEIDVIATRDNVAYMCEVKYRHTADQGSGLDYITPRKLAQMRFAAVCWVQANHWPSSYQLCAIEVSGRDFRVTAAVKNP